jgi:hypothetical protein
MQSPTGDTLWPDWPLWRLYIKILSLVLRTSSLIFL